MHVTFDETILFESRKDSFDDVDEETQRMNLNNQPSSSHQGEQGDAQKDQPSTSQGLSNDAQIDKQSNEVDDNLPRSWRMVRYHPQEQIIDDVKRQVSIRRNLNDFCEHHAFISYIEPKNIKDTLGDDDWIIAMQEELNQFERTKYDT